MMPQWWYSLACFLGIHEWRTIAPYPTVAPDIIIRECAHCRHWPNWR